jgi:CheY-like chemotaxis protein
LAKKRVLLVEDEYFIAFELKGSLVRSGYEVLGPAASGLEAIEIARAQDPALVLMDIGLRGPMDGIEAARLISEFSQAKIVFATAYADGELKTRAMLLQPLGYLEKPFSIKQLEQLFPA